MCKSIAKEFRQQISYKGVQGANPAKEYRQQIYVHIAKEHRQQIYC
jgi:hypothetical protein